MTPTRFWIEFDVAPGDYEVHPSYSLAGLGCGVTGYTFEDVLHLLQTKLFRDDPLPPIRSVIEGVDINTLDPGHVLPNIDPPSERGIWFPRV